VLSEISMNEAFDTLLQLSKENKVSRLEVKNGDLWIVK